MSGPIHRHAADPQLTAIGKRPLYRVANPDATLPPRLTKLSSRQSLRGKVAPQAFFRALPQGCCPRLARTDSLPPIPPWPSSNLCSSAPLALLQGCCPRLLCTGRPLVASFFCPLFCTIPGLLPEVTVHGPFFCRSFCYLWRLSLRRQLISSLFL